jgi:hypothetical protein
MEDPHGYLYRMAMNNFRRRYGRALRTAKRSTQLVPADDEIAAPGVTKCDPLEDRRATNSAFDLERTTGFEPATPTLARWCSTAEPRPR